jgi:hypothetical protein
LGQRSFAVILILICALLLCLYMTTKSGVFEFDIGQSESAQGF